MSAISLWFLYKQYNRKHDESNRQWIKEIMYKFVILMYISPLQQARNEFKTIFCWLSTLQGSRQVLQARLKRRNMCYYSLMELREGKVNIIHSRSNINRRSSCYAKTCMKNRFSAKYRRVNDNIIKFLWIMSVRDHFKLLYRDL